MCDRGLNLRSPKLKSCMATVGAKGPGPIAESYNRLLDSVDEVRIQNLLILTLLLAHCVALGKSPYLSVSTSLSVKLRVGISKHLTHGDVVKVNFPTVL